MRSIFTLAQQIESLESRTLLTVTLSGGVLTITGGAGDDVLAMNQVGSTVFVSSNGHKAQTFRASDISKISINMGSGNDRVGLEKLDGEDPVLIKAVISGSKGDDTLRGGNGNDTFSGGSGDDLLDGGLGADVLSGDTGFDNTTYATRLKAITVSFDDLANDGEANEKDNVQTEGVIGGAGNDDFIMDKQDTGHAVRGGAGIDIVDYEPLAVAPTPGTFNNVSLDDVTNDGVNGTDDIRSDIENVYGSEFADSIVGSGADNVLLGNDGNDKIRGGEGNDTLSGGAGQDSMLGEGDDDFMINFNFSTGDNPDNDALSGGTGVNFDEPDPLDGPVTGIQNDYDSVDRNTGSGGKSHGAVALGEIRPLGVPAPLVINGTTGNDTIIINQNATVVSYTLNGAKTETPLSAVNSIVVNGGEGDDLVLTARPTDGANVVSLPTNMFGDNGNDTISGGSNRDTIDGGAGNDSLVGNNGNDSLIGNEGSDILIGARGNDYLVGDTNSSDTTGFGGDDIHGNSGNDFVDYHGRNDPLRITMDDDVANDGGTNGAEGDNVHSDVENCLGGNGNDRIVGNNSANFLSGSGGNDSLRGEGGIDKLIGNTGKDTLKGDSDIDLFFMSDGSADDFDTALDTAGHPITDFLNADNTVDVSLTSGRAVGTASA